MFVYNNQNKLNLFNVIENKIYVIYTSKNNLKISKKTFKSVKII